MSWRGAPLHADDTPVPVLSPGSGKTRTGRQWVHLRDERPHGGPASPAVPYRFTPDRRGEHAQTQLASFRDGLHADGYVRLGKLYHGAVVEVACWAQGREYAAAIYSLYGQGAFLFLSKPCRRICLTKRGCPRFRTRGSCAGDKNGQ
jgi:hypothetical protein